jgi:hypothetical protein
MKRIAIAILIVLAVSSWGMNLKRIDVQDDSDATAQWNFEALEYKFRQAGRGATSLVGATQTLLAGSTISVKTGVILVAGSGAVTMTSALPDGSQGQVIVIVGTSDTNTVTIQHGAVYNTKLASGLSFVLGAGDSLVLLWIDSIGDWGELKRTDVS